MPENTPPAPAPTDKPHKAPKAPSSQPEPAPTPVQPVTPVSQPTNTAAAAGTNPPKSYLVASLLSIMLGGIGVDRFYMGYIGLGILKLITLGGCGIWYLIDAILILTNNLRDAQGRPLVGYAENRKTAWIFAAVVYGLSTLSGIASSLINVGAFLHSADSYEDAKHRSAPTRHYRPNEDDERDSDTDAPTAPTTPSNPNARGVNSTTPGGGTF